MSSRSKLDNQAEMSADIDLVLWMYIPIDVHKAGEKNVLFNRPFNKD
ncbi:hypothetical protein DLR60_06675 [Vibrio tarriae]|uniref:Uncharacterized protein n=1 Tax=Vibrio tarriae TaxID=2014742 RepID=A0AAU8WGP7_9VIBR|nr:hypothetical protein CEQ48_13360 [Vibrio tarriae]QEO46385.1 hypothetical protein F0315_14225 [Vibrio cholerae]RBM30387.1 hypothetical protein DLR61_07070 [Vibrio tarriae]RBM31895.1 hypothetical protein DLR59_00440 [Vibrio tarriae]RBM37083.1 hypothetical protein DLR63_13635 [Vibrio tarriae]